MMESVLTGLDNLRFASKWIHKFFTDGLERMV